MLDLKLVPTPLVPTGLNAVSSNVVEIFPVPSVTEFFGRRINSQIPFALTTDDREKYRQSLLGEIAFQTKRGNVLPFIGDNSPVAELHKMFTTGNIGHLGLRNISFDSNKLTTDFCVVPHPAYTLFHDNARAPIREFGSNLGAALILVTKDDKIVIQHRGPKNRIYGEVPGASVAGLVDAFHAQGKDSLNFLEVAANHLLDEGSEEIGLAPSVTDSFNFSGVQIDKIALHHELTFWSKTNLTADEIRVNSIANSTKQDAAKFKENIILLDATPEVIASLLTENRCPFPTTHAGPLLLLGAALIDPTNGPAAQAWLERTKNAMDDNYRTIDSLATGGKYAPGTLSLEQGLPSFREELRRLFGSNYEYVECTPKKAA